MNNTIFFFFYNLTHQSAFFDGLVTFFAIYFLYIVIISAFLFLIFHHKIFPSENPVREFVNKWRDFILLCFSGGFAWVLAKVLKVLIHTPRPFIVFHEVRPLFFESGYAFPSGHSMVAAAIAAAIFFTNKKAGYIFAIFALLIGLARITSGVHFPVDIMGGFILGALVAYAIRTFFLHLNKIK